MSAYIEEKRRLMIIVLKIDDTIDLCFDKEQFIVDELADLIEIRGILMDRIYTIQQKINFNSNWLKDKRYQSVVE
jgi:hypothetical protein